MRTPGDLIGYIALRLGEPCGRTVPGSLGKAVIFLEMAGEVSVEKRISADQGLQHFLLEVERSELWKPQERVIVVITVPVTLTPHRKKLFVMTLLLILCQMAVGATGPQPQVPDHSGHYRTSTHHHHHKKTDKTQTQ